MSGIRYGVGNLDVWEQVGIAVGFGAGGITIFACMECGDQVTIQPGDRTVSIGMVIDLLKHVAMCPPQKKPEAPQGPVAMEIVEKGVYRFYENSPEVNNDDADDAA